MWLACDLNISASFFSIVITLINTKAKLIKSERSEVLFSLYSDRSKSKTRFAQLKFYLQIFFFFLKSVFNSLSFKYFTDWRTQNPYRFPLLNIEYSPMFDDISSREI